jgi:hypothetical protein
MITGCYHPPPSPSRQGRGSENPLPASRGTGEGRVRVDVLNVSLLISTPMGEGDFSVRRRSCARPEGRPRVAPYNPIENPPLEKGDFDGRSRGN